jgi:hypothetical protein
VEFGNQNDHVNVIEEYGYRIHEIFLVVELTFIFILERSSDLEEFDWIVILSFHESLHSGS